MAKCLLYSVAQVNKVVGVGFLQCDVTINSWWWGKEWGGGYFVTITTIWHVRRHKENNVRAATTLVSMLTNRFSWSTLLKHTSVLNSVHSIYGTNEKHQQISIRECIQMLTASIALIILPTHMVVSMLEPPKLMDKTEKLIVLNTERCGKCSLWPPFWNE